MRNLRFCSTMATALAVGILRLFTTNQSKRTGSSIITSSNSTFTFTPSRWRRIFCSLFLVAAAIASVGAVASSRAVSQRDLPNQLVAATPTPTPCSAWVERAPVPYNAGGVFAASDGAHVYAGGGRSDTTTFHNDLLRYDPGNDSWAPLMSSPDQHYASQAVYFNGKIYNMGGFVDRFNVTNTARIYDIATNTWTTGAPMPSPLGLQATVLWNGVIYIVGGYNGSAETNTLYAYDIASDTWTTLAPMPQAVYAPGFGAINGKLYIAGGYVFGVLFNTLQIYDIATNTWDPPGANVPQAVGYCGSTVFNGLLYLYGGIVQGSPRVLTNITQIYDPVSNTWSSGPNMNVAMWGSYGTAVGNDSIVAPGGFDVNFVGLNDNEQLINIPCSTPTPTPTPTATATPMPTATPTPTSTPRQTPAPRPRPTPAPRPTP
jgi:N-acetylneuraminic acid mutarotase